MGGKSRTGLLVILTVAIMLLVVPWLNGCTGPIAERLSNIGKPAKPTSTPTAPPPTAPPATLEPSPTSASPTPIPPSPSPSARPTSTPTLTPSVTLTPGPDGVVAADALTLRGGPGTVYPRLGTLQRGDPLSVTARDEAGDWLAVTTSSGRKGWVAAPYVELNLPRDEIPTAAEVPPTPVPPPTSTPTQPPPVADQVTEPAPSSGIPPGPSVDDQIALISAGKHGQLPQPTIMGDVAAGGEVELTILNDTPYTLTLLIGSPSQTTVTVEGCATCSPYGVAGPLFCQEEGRPRQSVRVKPGTMKVAARVDNPSVIPFAGEWILKPNSAYFNCFFIVAQ